MAADVPPERLPLPDDDLFELACIWHVRHADGRTEDILLEHGNIVENDVGTSGQFLIYRSLGEASKALDTSTSGGES